VEYLYTRGETRCKWSTCTQGEQLYVSGVTCTLGVFLYKSGVSVHRGSNCTQVEYLYTRGETIRKWSTCTQGEDGLWSELPINKWVYWTGLMFWNHPQSFPEIPTLWRQSLYNICERSEGCGSILWNGYDVVERVREGCTLETTVNMPTCSSNICTPLYFNIYSIFIIQEEHFLVYNWY